MFKIDTKEFAKLSRHLDGLAKKTPRSIAGTLTSQAAGTRNTAIEEIERSMTVRSKPFIHSRIQFTRATEGHLLAEVGSVAKDGFTGFLEQERGMVMIDRPERAITLSARGDKKKRRVSNAARLKRSNVFLRSKDYRGQYRSGYRMPSGPHLKAVGMIRSLAREGYRKPFIIEGHDRIPDGLYKLKGRRDKQKLIQLQAFDERVFVKKDQWMRPAIDKFLKRWDSHREWSFQFGRFAKKKPT